MLPLYGMFSILPPVASSNTATARWPGLPAPAELNASRFAFAVLTSSAIVRMFVFGCSPTNRPDDAMIITGFKSAGLNGIDLYRCGFTVSVVSMPTSTV